MSEIQIERRSYESVWKNVALFLAGMVLTGSIAWATYVRTAVTSADVQAMIDQNLKVVQFEIDQLTKQYEQLSKQGETMNGKLDYIIQNPQGKVHR